MNQQKIIEEKIKEFEEELPEEEYNHLGALWYDCRFFLRQTLKDVSDKSVENEMSVKSIVSLLNSEIKWCKENKEKDNNYQAGFIKGVEQAKYLIIKADKAISAQEEKIKKYKEIK